MGGIIMTQEDKELLLKDLCARLPYGVFCNIGLDYPLPLQSLFVDKLDGILLDFYEDGKDYQVYLGEVKPYLFPLSSMSEEVTREFNKTLDWVRTTHGYSESEMTWDTFDCVNKYHIDYRGLIEKGLTIDATGLNIY